MRAGLDGVLLRRQAEGVITQGMQDVFAQHAVVAGVDVRGDITERVPHVQACAGGVGEHVLDEQLVVRQRAVRGQFADRVRRVKRAVVRPVVLPLVL